MQHNCVERRGLYFIIVLIVWLLPATLCADMGRITTSDAIIQENAQKAIIFHNLEEQVLILGTELQASKTSSVLRFIPFPSVPTASLVEGDPFSRVSELMREYEMVFLSQSKSRSDTEDKIPVDIVFASQMGAHDLTIIELKDITEFKNWVETFLKGKGLTPGNDFDRVTAVASDYVQRDIRYFVFDIVAVTPDAQSIAPMAYRFKSEKLYYPLKTSNTFGGTGTIDLVIIAPGTMCDPLNGDAFYVDDDRPYACMGPMSIKGPYAVMASTSARIFMGEVKSIYPPAGSLFDKDQPMIMQLIRYQGEYHFDEDILIDISKLSGSAINGTGAVSNFNFSIDQEISLMLNSEGIPPYDARTSLGNVPLPLKTACLKAAQAAIAMEILHAKQTLAGAKEDSGDRDAYLFWEQRLKGLQIEQDLYDNMNPNYFQVKPKKTVRVKISHTYEQGALLEIEDMSRSGPFFHVAGIKNDDYGALEPGKTYTVVIYRVYPRYYPFPSEYVYIEDFH